MWWFIIVPLLWIAFYKIVWHKRIEWPLVLLHIGSVLITSCAFFMFIYISAVSDFELWHGKVIDKVREHDTYEESYSCNCTTDSKGNTSCQTCYRTVYTVDWYIKTTLGNINIDGDESYSRTVYLQGDPERYKKVVIGEMCTRENNFTNYVKAAKNSLFNTSKYNTNTNAALPQYPKIYDIYRTKTVLNINTSVDVKIHQDILNESLKTLASKKQVNVIVVFVNSDSNYRYALEKHWLGGKKNDAIFIIGTEDSKTITWIDGFTFGLSMGNHLMLTEIFDTLRGKEINEQLIPTITTEIAKSFKRKPMADFKYLAKEIKPSRNQLLVLIFIQLFLNIGITYFNFYSTSIRFRRY